ncbi:NAD(P)/FAD-dependent oxidoreductase [Paenarthrobacter sp. NPDC089322]|uniref:flavin-containing monooxygenase n=1 Tax=Paenarthrobacter sp. NPDC089322 TaxID=3155065 RepID=UPI0034345DB2
MTDVAIAPAREPGSTTTPRMIVDEWVGQFTNALSSQNVAAAELFLPDGVIRDLLALSWDFRNAIGHQEISAILAVPAAHRPTSIQVRPGNASVLVEEGNPGTISAFLQFRNSAGNGFGHVRLVQQNDDGTWLAASLVLALDAVDSHPECHLDARPSGKTHGPVRNRTGWQEGLDPEFTRQEPDVVILGAGHNGLMLAARLGALGIPALVLEPNQRVGDNWRKRYSSLALHTPLASDHLPYLPFPSTWPRFTPKDKLGDFLESYAKLLDLAVWTATTVEGAEFDESSRRWIVDIKRQGKRRRINPRHLVFATGMNAAPNIPEVPGRSDFQGTVMHAVDYKGHAEWRGKRAVVVGSGVSGHDIAQDLAEHGVDVTMIQRSGTFVMNTSTFHKVMHANHVSGKYSTEEADLLNASTPFGALPAHGPKHVELIKAMDRELLDGLVEAGFELSDGPDGQGVLGLIFGLNGTGYYYNAGASELIIDGTIKLRHGSVEGLTPNGVLLDGDRTLDADLVVFATGYQGAPSVVRQVLGDDIADRVGEFAKVGADREYGRLWRRTGVEQLWFMVSLGIGDGRFYSKLLALQLAAMEAGTMPYAEQEQ